MVRSLDSDLQREREREGIKNVMDFVSELAQGDEVDWCRIFLVFVK